MTDKIEFEIFIAVDENGKWFVGKEPDDVVSDLSQEGGYCMRTARVTVKMSKPEMAEFEVEVPEEPDEEEAAAA
jgi:hypothetical protein